MIKVNWTEEVFPEGYNRYTIKDLQFRIVQKDNEFVKEGTDIIAIYHPITGYWGETQFTIKAPITGVFEVGEAYNKVQANKNYGTQLYSITTFDEVVADFDWIKYQIYTDSFTRNKGVRWTNLPRANVTHPFYNVNITFSFEYDNGVPYLLVRQFEKPKQKDTITFLFEDGEIRSYTVSDKVIKDSSIIRQAPCYIICFELTKSDLDKFTSSSVISYRYESKGVRSKDSQIALYNNQELGQILIKKFANKFAEALADIDHKWLIDQKEESTSPDEPCYVYLMVDTANGYHKIGISNNPEYREGTLQSEKPTIELLCAKQFPSRVIAKAIESALHKTYEAKHLRGEWFQLDAKDIIDLMATLK